VATRVDTILGGLRALGVQVSGLATDSRNIAAGDVFLAWPGAKQDGRAHIADAVSRGAAAVLWEREGYEWSSDISAANPAVPNLWVEGLRDMAGPLAHEVYGRPSEKMWTMGVTGTNGKTSSSQWLARACIDCGANTAVIGTLGLGFPGGALDATVNTTPDPVLLHKTLAKLHAAGAQGVAMEVSSIGLDQGRVNGVRFGAALYTNLSRDHLDYHGDMEHYAAAKQRLFSMPGLRHAVLNMDDVQGVSIARQLSGGSVNRAGYSLYEGAAARAGLECWIEAQDIEVTPQGLAFRVRSSWGPGTVRNGALLGRFNVSNLLGVLATMLVSGVPFDRAIAALGTLEPVSGRMQRIGGGAQPLVVVDYAHSPDALEQTLATLTDVARSGGGKLWCVFGCGGDRDRGKRAMMGAVATRSADRIVVTSDNPRGEDPAAIIADVLAGMHADSGRSIVTEPDRARAIALAIGEAGPGDVVLLAGKGHEAYQEIAGTRHPFSDLAAANDALLAVSPAQGRA
jgi:UDP-N-acetylmuramoyl-L-alanyl-D-glutamate--2,6-diaminopimelate ligase